MSSTAGGNWESLDKKSLTVSMAEPAREEDLLHEYSANQYWGSMTIWCESGSADPCLRPMDPDSNPDPPIFVIDSRGQRKTHFKKGFLLLLFKGTFTSFFKDKKSKRSTVTKQ